MSRINVIFVVAVALWFLLLLLLFGGDLGIGVRQQIVKGAVGMVDMALDELSQNQVVDLDEERKAAMVSNLLVVLCGEEGAQPVLNTGSLYT